LLFTLLPFLWAARPADEPKMKRVKLTDQVSALMPLDFRPMTDDEIASRLFTYRKPVAMFTDAEAAVDLGLNISPTNWKYEDLAMLKGFYKSTIMQLYTEVRMEREVIEEINGKKFAVFEFSSVVRPDKKEVGQQKAQATYTYILYTVHNEKVCVVNFSCPYSARARWKPIAARMMQSVKIGAI
jgi:hypothetical protein